MKDFCLLYDKKKRSETTSKYYDSLTSLTIQTRNRFICPFSYIYFMWYLWISLFQFLIEENLNWCWTTDRNCCYFKFNRLFWWNTLRMSLNLSMYFKVFVIIFPKGYSRLNAFYLKENIWRQRKYTLNIYEICPS